MLLKIGLAHHRGHHQRVIGLAADARECDSAVIHRERQMLFQSERDHLMQAARVFERQFEQAFDGAVGGQGRDDDIGLPGFDHEARERAAQVGLVIGANLVEGAGEGEGIPRALGHRRAYAIGSQLECKYSLSHSAT